jgi:hypothetical protein
MNASADLSHDVMQVCVNGHVITSLLHSNPGRGLSHCDRCGAATLDRCPTCGHSLPGAVPVPGLVLLGELRPPLHCHVCGAMFPWATAPENSAVPSPLSALETLLRRLPRAIRQLRSRQGHRPPFRVEDEHDLEDLLRALLPLYFDNVRPECRTPRYAADTRTDFLLPEEGLSVLVKQVQVAGRASSFDDQVQEDVAYYARQRFAGTLVIFLYDPEGRVREPRQAERGWSRSDNELSVACVVAT